MSNECFGSVSWCDDDIRAALEFKLIPITEERVNIIHDKLQKHWFTDYMIDAGWEYIYAVIDEEIERE